MTRSECMLWSLMDFDVACRGVGMNDGWLGDFLLNKSLPWDIGIQDALLRIAHFWDSRWFSSRLLKRFLVLSLITRKFVCASSSLAALRHMRSSQKGG